MQDRSTEKAIDGLSMLDLGSNQSEEEIEVIYVENLTGAEIVEFARYGELQIIEELSRLGLLQKLTDATDARGNTALHMAAANGHTEMVSFILAAVENNAEYVNRLNVDGNTALHWSCLNGHADIVRALLGAGADHTVTVYLIRST